MENQDRNSGRSAVGTAVHAPTKPSPARTLPRRLPLWKLLLHNDDLNTMDGVVGAITRITPLQTAQAVQKMLEAHFKGTSLLLVTHLERAELYVQQFRSVNLHTTIEPDA